MFFSQFLFLSWLFRELSKRKILVVLRILFPLRTLEWELNSVLKCQPRFDGAYAQWVHKVMKRYGIENISSQEFSENYSLIFYIRRGSVFSDMVYVYLHSSQRRKVSWGVNRMGARFDFDEHYDRLIARGEKIATNERSAAEKKKAQPAASRKKRGYLAREPITFPVSAVIASASSPCDGGNC